MRNLVLLLVGILSTLLAYSQKTPSIERIDPTNWWVGMKNPELQLLVYGPNAGSLTYTIDYPGVRLNKIQQVENPNYAFLDLTIDASAKAGTFKITGRYGNKTISRSYELKQRTNEPKGTGVSGADLIYLIMPDRFANGDVTNDKLAKMDTNADRTSPYLRHGGDLKGIADHLNYLKELGVTAIWLTPVIENDEQLKKEGSGRMQAGYHGYHFTDHYRIDRRFGGHEGYVQFCKTAHQLGFKVVQDAVYNHVSDEHWMFKDKPMKDWFNNWPEYTNSSHKEQPLYDPHGSDIDRRVMLDGWFTPFLPDVNQRNPFCANYLIQHAIWSTEIFGLDAWRIDTYKYNDQAFMNRCNEALLAEYPTIHLFGESTASNPMTLSYFVRSNVNFPFKSNLPGTLDFPLNQAINDALRQDFGWEDGINRVYQTLAQDGLFADPQRLVTQLDNHDMDRYFSVIGEDFDKYKLGVTWLLTTRGIPTWYYGTEILMKNFRNPTDAEVRLDFPGGFPGDKENKFIAQGRSARENEAFDFVSKLANYRKSNPAVHSGKLMQFVPRDGVYVYFRYDEKSTVMVVSNTMGKEMSVETSRFSERTQGFKSARNVVSGETIGSLEMIKVPAKTALVLELLR